MFDLHLRAFYILPEVVGNLVNNETAVHFRVDGNEKVEATVAVDVINDDIEEVTTVIRTQVDTVCILYHLCYQPTRNLKKCCKIRQNINVNQV